MSAWLGDWGPFLILCGVGVLIVAGMLVADALGTHRARVDLLVALMRGGR